MAQQNEVVDSKTVDTVIVGAGLHGIALAARLKSLGFEDFVMVDPQPPMGNWARLTRNQALKTLRSDGMSHVHPVQNGFADFLAREKIDADKPAPLGAFNRFTWQTIGEYDLMSNFLPGLVDKVQTNGSYAVMARTLSGTMRLDAKRVVVAVGPGVPNMPGEKHPTNVIHSDAFSINDFKLRVEKSGFDGSVAIVGAGLTAGTLALQISDLRAVSAVHLFVRGSIGTSQLEVDKSWLTDDTMLNVFRKLDYSLRAKLIRGARENRGMTPEIFQRLMERVASNRIRIHEMKEDITWVVATNDTCGCATPKNDPQLHFRLVICATGYTVNAKKISFLDPGLLGDTWEGMPTLNANYASRQASSLYFMGRLSELNGGPLGRNLAGAMDASAKIASVITQQNVPPNRSRTC